MANIRQAEQTNKRTLFKPLPKSNKPPFLDTLELTAEKYLKRPIYKPSENTPSLTKQSLLKAVKRKAFQNHYLPILAQLAEQEHNEYWRLRTWKVYHCAELLLIDKGEYMRKRCKLSECLICQGYKTNERIKLHLPILQELHDLQFMTLTIPNVLVYQLRPTIKDMSKVFRSIIDRLRKQGYKARGTRNLETTFNSDRGDFHPHFHCVIEGKEIAELFVQYWHEAWQKKGVILSEKAQNIRSFGSKESDLLEAFKYANKIISQGKDGNKSIYSWGLYESIKATSGGKGGIRNFQTFGFTKSEFSHVKRQKNMTVDKALPSGSYSYIFDKDANFFDYVSFIDGTSLTDYQMPEKMRELLTKNIV